MLGLRKDSELEALKALERRLGCRFRHRALLKQALTHPSYANEQGLAGDYERLEFLGDSVLGLAAAEWLFATYAEVAEGEMSELKSYLVSRSSLARWAGEMDLGAALRVGVGEERSGGREKDSLLADAFEAVLGALFVDRGWSAARAVLIPRFVESLERRPAVHLGDAKTRLQEAAQAGGSALPEYRLVAEEGPDHEKWFTVECWLDGSVVGSGTGRSKKLAEQRAAAVALAALRPPTGS